MNYYVRKTSGFTLIELMVVLIIVVILTTFSSTQYFRFVEKNRGAEAIEVLTRIYKGYKIMVIDEILDPATYDNPPDNKLVDGTRWNPKVGDEGDPKDDDWARLGFEENPNKNPALFFSYNFKPKGTTIASPCAAEFGFPDNIMDNNMAIANRRNAQVAFNQGSCNDGAIIINCDTGEIDKTDEYQ